MWIQKAINEFMNSAMETTDVDYVIASDTDSLFLHMDTMLAKSLKITPDKLDEIPINSLVDQLDKLSKVVFLPFIETSYKKLATYVNAYEQKMIMKREKICDKGIWTAKKRYILNVWDEEGVRFKNPVVKVTGLEMIKSSTPAIVRKKLKEVTDIIMTKDEAAVLAFIETFKEEYKTLPAEDIAFPRGINGVQEYSDTTNKDRTQAKKGAPIHVRGAIQYNYEIKHRGLTKKYPMILGGEKIKFLYLKEPNSFQSYVMTFSTRLPTEFGAEKYIDYETMFEKSFIEPLKIITNAIGWKTEATSSLEAFFS